MQTGLSGCQARSLPPPNGSLIPPGRCFTVSAIGVDRVIAEAGVAKATFYRHFPSKDALIDAWILRAEARSLAALPPEDGPAALTAYAEAMIAIAGHGGCMGCTCQGSAAEFSDPAHPAHAAALGVKQRVIAGLVRRAVAQGGPTPMRRRSGCFCCWRGSGPRSGCSARPPL